jgi:hypothetical protein
VENADHPGAELTELPGNEPVILHNETCVYCGLQMDKRSRTKDHVIGRRFVPRGKLDQSWNLIVEACRKCNNRKSALENDLSAISMYPDAWGIHAHNDKSLAAESQRKARNSLSVRTSKRVMDSAEQLTIKGSVGSALNVTFNLTAPPQADPHQRVAALARLHVMACFYWLTYNKTTRRGGYWPGEFFALTEAKRADWGNVVHVAFMQKVVGWEPRLLFSAGADGFFKIAIRRNAEAICWSWALEWNHNYRTIGFFGDADKIRKITDTIPPLEITPIFQNGNERLAYRIEVPLDSKQDLMFQWCDRARYNKD